MDRPPYSIASDLESTSRKMAFSVELFPAPLAPIIPTLHPSGTSKLMPLTATTRPYATRRFRTDRPVATSAATRRPPRWARPAQDKPRSPADPADGLLEPLLLGGVQARRRLIEEND